MNHLLHANRRAIDHFRELVDRSLANVGAVNTIRRIGGLVCPCSQPRNRCRLARVRAVPGTCRFRLAAHPGLRLDARANTAVAAASKEACVERCLPTKGFAA